ncbi:MAG: gliding motility-associated C-terminal domain-containing protein [Chitinophagales bacterium]|nr:gliding motility-associated C-terminal domain-containing protein [Chitinophagales bacterium]
MKKYTKTLLLAVASCLLLFSPKLAKACHFGAADLFVTYTGPGIDGCTGTTVYQYDVTCIIYYACQTCYTDGGAGGVNIAYSSALAPGGNVTCNPAKPNADTLHALCPAYNDSNSCKQQTAASAVKFPAFQARTYVGTVVLPSAQPDWTFSFSSCCRNNSNLVGGSGNSIYIEAMLNNQIKYNNSTPRFLNSPLPYICVNQPNIYLTGPFDPNGDSLSVQQQAPMSGPAAFLTYNPGFSVADPVGSSGANPYKLNSTTGAATFTPLNIGNPCLNFRIDEYDRSTGLRTAYTMRDVQISILPCAAPPPGIDSLKPTLTINDGSLVDVDAGNGKTNGKAIVTCPGNKLNFSINSSTNNTASYLDMYANTFVIPGSTFNIVGKGTNSITGTFDWTPTVADIGEHTLIVTSADSSCNANQPIVLKNYTVVLIKVIKGLDAGNDVSTCELNPIPRQLFVKGYGNLKLNIKWKDISGGQAAFLNSDTIYNPISIANKTTNYIVTSTDLKGNCKSSDTVTVFVDKSNTIDIFPLATNFVMCRPDYLQLDAIVTGRGPITNMNCGPTTNNSCTTPDTLFTWGSPTFGTGFSFDTIGTNTPVMKIKDAVTGKFQFLITKEELKEYGLPSSTIQSISFETTKNTTTNFDFSNFTISMKCVDASVKSLNKATGFITGTVPVYTAPGNIQFPNQWHKFKFDTPYSWDTTKNLLVEICWSNNPQPGGACVPGNGEPPILKFMPTTYAATLFVGPTVVTNTSVCGTTTAANIEQYVTRPVFKFDYCEAPGSIFTFKWTPGEYLSDSTIKQPLAYVNKTVSYSVETGGRNGCWLRDTINVFVPQHDFYALPKDTAICFGETAPLEIRNGTYYKWYEYENGQYKSAHQSLSCDLCANPIAKPKKTTHYKIAVGDEVFCFDTIDAYITVKPLPVVKILTPDTMVKAGQSLQLMVNGARLYNWSPVASLNNPNISYPIATPTESTMYVVAGIASNGCRSFDTVRVGVDYRSNLIVPTAFSPNADGKNDVFRVSNMTVQRYVEFRVFNRWGQEVYNGTDGRKGWDGTWKGVPQEIGNYQYLIRVAYPDGFVETYKGDVTLVR